LKSGQQKTLQKAEPSVGLALFADYSLIVPDHHPMSTLATFCESFFKHKIRVMICGASARIAPVVPATTLLTFTTPLLQNSNQSNYDNHK